MNRERTVELMNVSYDNTTTQEALKYIVDGVKEEKKRTVFFLNADCLYKAQYDNEYRKVINNADLLLPDGIGISLATRLFGNRMTENLNGTDFSPKLIEVAGKEKLSIYFLGGKEGIAEKAAENVKKNFPDIKIAGAHHGFFKNDDAQIDKINQTNADILFVAMGVPRQEKWIAKHRERLSPKICLGVGALLDYLSGSIPRAPLLMRKMRLEWSWRIFVDPKRMIQRYCVDGTHFVLLAIAQRIKDKL